jgi:deoxyribodipyrimidine photo-lyase
MIEPERIRALNDCPPRANGHYVLYWMQQSQRESHNPALEYSIRSANRLSKTVVVLFVLTEQYPEANERHFAFMLQGLREVAI